MGVIFIASRLGHVAVFHWSHGNNYSRFIITPPQKARLFKFQNKRNSCAQKPPGIPLRKLSIYLRRTRTPS